MLWAKVVYDKSYLDEKSMSLDDLQAQLDLDMTEINATMPAYKMVKKYFLSDKPTVKTTTQKTKRNEELKQIEEEMKELEL